MEDTDDIRTLLRDIRDNQARMLANQERQIAISTEQLDRARKQVEESIGLQREAIARTRSIGRIAVPGIALCVAAILYLVLRYF